MPLPAEASLQALVLAAYHADASDPPIAPVGEYGYSTLFGPIPAALAVLRVAAEIEPRPTAVMEWYRRTPIRELGNLSAEQLVALGRAEMVIAFPSSIRDGTRAGASRRPVRAHSPRKLAMRIPVNKFRSIVGEIANIAARREELTSGAFDVLEYRHPSLAQALLDHIGSKRRAAYWLCAPQRAWGGKSPCEMLADGDEESVWDLLEGLDVAEVPGHQPRSRPAY